jgi:hypothetical protein
LVLLEDIEARGGALDHKVVRTHGTLDVLDLQQHHYSLKDGSARVLILPVPTVADEMRSLVGREIEVEGLVRTVPYRQQVIPFCGPESRCNDPQLPALPDLADHPGYPQMSITIWKGSDLTPPGGKKQEVPLMSLESLVDNPGRRDGQLVRVVGEFRGRNLFGDLPSRSRRRSEDWVIKDDFYAAWITGRKPKGKGWELDPSLKRDTGKWIEVIGRVYTSGGITYIQAREVALSTPPRPDAQAKAPPPPPEKPKLPPVIVFALPLDGEGEVPQDTRFMVQFSKDMDEKTFAGRVRLRYAGRPQPGDRGFDGVTIRYDGGKRALVVDPGDLLRPGRTVELLLLPGIIDIDGLELTPRPGRQAYDAVDVLRYRVGS